MRGTTVIIALLLHLPLWGVGRCSGKVINPITDLAWSSMYPITIAGNINVGPSKDTKKERVGGMCWCKSGLIPAAGVPVGFWEPAFLVDVTRRPFCFVGLGGLCFGKEGKSFGLLSHGDAKNAFYHVHLYRYPVLSLMGVMGNMACFEKDGMDILYLSELDLLWNDDDLALLIAPESLAAASPKSQLLCAADCAAVNAGPPLDDLHWCSGCLGSVFPLTGFVMGVGSDVQASALLVHRALYKAHKTGLLKGTVGYDGLCGPYPMRHMRKSQYKIQMCFPVAQRSSAQPLGRSDVLWGQGRSFPIKGEDFCYAVWRRRDCCVLLSSTQYTGLYTSF